MRAGDVRPRDLVDGIGPTIRRRTLTSEPSPTTESNKFILDTGTDNASLREIAPLNAMTALRDVQVARDVFVLHCEDRKSVV